MTDKLMLNITASEAGVNEEGNQGVKENLKGNLGSPVGSFCGFESRRAHS